MMKSPTTELCNEEMMGSEDIMFYMKWCGGWDLNPRRPTPADLPPGTWT